jgi:hypothetical protein
MANADDWPLLALGVPSSQLIRLLKPSFVKY